MEFTVRANFLDPLHLLEAADPDATDLGIIEPGGILVQIDDPTNGARWQRVTYRRDHPQAPLTGFVDAAKIEVAEPGPRLPLSEEGFVAECVRAELAFNAGDNAGEFPIIADYLIAWALLETQLKNTGPFADRKNAEGPFDLCDDDWTAYAAVRDPDGGSATVDRALPLLHPYAAAEVAHMQMQELSKALSVEGAPDGPFVPSYLNVYHCTLFDLKQPVLDATGAPTQMSSFAAAIQATAKTHRLNEAENKDMPLDEMLAEFLPNAAQRAALLARRARLLQQGGASETIGGFLIKTANALNEALVSAFTRIKTHFPEILPEEQVLSGPAPWMAVADAEHAKWRGPPESVETDSGGAARVVDYFRATDSGITTVQHWCGAFVAHCLQEAGPQFAATIIKESARASSWKNWGNTTLRLRSRGDDNRPDIPRGAVVVTVPLAPGASGHVGFFSRFIDADTLELLGGNQSDRVKLMPVHRSKIVAIKWVDTGDPEPDNQDITPLDDSPVNATEQDRITMARTLFGEARGEPRQGMDAVADVILNRVRSPRYPDSVVKVCRQAYQFSCWNRNDPNFSKIKNLTAASGGAKFDLCLQVADAALRRAAPLDVSPDTLHYYATSIAKPSWVRKSPNAAVTLRAGHHIFYRGIR